MNRSQISFCAIRSKNGLFKNFNISKDGKYSSFKEIGRNLQKKIEVETKTMNDLLAEEIFNHKFPILLKIDIEGLEKEVINDFDFKSDLRIKHLIVEGTGYKEIINRENFLVTRNDYIEIYNFN